VREIYAERKARPLIAHPAVPRIIGHRGARASAPENTLASIRQAHREGAAWVEFDVKLTADGRAILMHDETLDRTTTGRGPVARATLAEIRALDAGVRFSAQFAGERVPTLEEALALLASLFMGFNLEIKPCKGRERETAETGVRVVREQWPRHLPVPIISSFQAESLRAARAAAEELPLGYLVERLPRDWAREAAGLGCRFVHPGQRWLTRRQAEAVKSAGYPLLVWTVNDVARARELLEWGADALITDAPATLAAGLSSL
jgi:glycerophosphoryl diester phosphodiesterase